MRGQKRCPSITHACSRVYVRWRPMRIHIMGVGLGACVCVCEGFVCMRACVCGFVYVCACVLCVRACVRVCVRVSV